MSLAAMQRDFTAWLVDAPNQVARHLGASAEDGLAVYHHAYRTQLVDCLRDTHEKCAAWLGDDAFEAAALHHIAMHPPKSWTLGRYGHDFAASLSTLYPDDREVAELAWLDSTLRQAFDGPDAAPVDLATLGEVDWEAAILRFVPTLTIGRTLTNSAAIWSAIAQGNAPPAAQMLPRAGALLVWRRDLSPHFRSIEEDEQSMLTLALAGRPFGALCATLVDELGEEPGAAMATDLLRTWLGDGLIAAFA
jgi:hypothetical protein